ncbi:MAG: hypothetical protein R3305_08670, partial [Gammaproteobacteria bacterium]|nr:hypothetical protein [Gammaproteobacteria bacterium]
ARFAIVSSGFNNQWNFPRPEVVERWETNGARVLATGDHGAVEVVLVQDRIDVSTLRARRPRYWHADRPSVSGASARTAL